MILLSFDIEEFDLTAEYGKPLNFSGQLSISTQGTLAILDMLNKYGLKATFFVTANYAIHQQHIIKKIIDEGHELASHGYYHACFETQHFAESKLLLEEVSGSQVNGFRMARMMPVDLDALKKSGYTYNSSLNPTWIPGRYNHLAAPRTWFIENGITQLPASVSPNVRFPLFWLSFHNLPMTVLKNLCFQTYRKDGYLNLYFHPWEFTDLTDKRFGLPNYISRNSGVLFTERLENLIIACLKKKITFNTISEFIAEKVR